MAVCCAGGILGDHVTAEINSDESQASFSVILTHHARACQRAQLILFMIWYVEVVKSLWSLLEPLLSVPCHVLNGKKGAIVLQDEVEEPMRKNRTIGAFDHTWKDGQARRR